MSDALMQYFTLTLIPVAALVYVVSQSRRREHYAPGPPEHWLIGNLLRLPIKAAWLQLKQWHDSYGPLVFLHGLGNHILVLNEIESVTDLLDKRGAVYSDRPVFTMVGELMGLDASVALLPSATEHRAHRRLAAFMLSPSAIPKYEAAQADLAILLCEQLMRAPEDFRDHVRLFAGRVIMSVTYGIKVQEADSQYITHAERTMEVIGNATVPGAYIVDLLPFLKYLPTWTPFIHFHRDAIEGRKMLMQLVRAPFEHVRRSMRAGTAPPSFTRDILLRESGRPQEPGQELDAAILERVMWTAGAMYGAGGESTFATILVFLMAMALNPAVQMRAQATIDEIVGPDRLPTFHDKDRLVYVDAVIKETMRWHPALPLGIARRTAADDTYKGYAVPRGTIVIPNVWAIASAPNDKYPPGEFHPERHLCDAGGANVVIDPRTYVFGFGRRLCPGQRLAENSLFISIASILACFDIRQLLDSAGQEVPIVPQFTEGLVSYPKDFKCRITLRDLSKRALIESRVAASKA